MLSWLFVLQVAVAGALIPVQSSVNAQLGRAIGHPLGAAMMNFFVGLIVLIGMATVLRAPFPTPARLSDAPFWMIVGGGVMGSFFVFTALFLTPKLGAATLVAGIMAGQIVGSLVIDHFGLFGLPQHELNVGRIAGVLLLIAGVVLVRKF
jgi:transporter family-2 protein